MEALLRARMSLQMTAATCQSPEEWKKGKADGKGATSLGCTMVGDWANLFVEMYSKSERSTLTSRIL